MFIELDPAEAREFLQSVVRDAAQPFHCEDTSTCDECGRRMLPHHMHCCGDHLHLTGSGACFTGHWAEHVTGQREGDFGPLQEWQSRIVGQDVSRANIHRKFQAAKCSMCGATENLTVDHLDPSLKGTADDGPYNWVTLCVRHHQLKTRVRGDHRARTRR